MEVKREKRAKHINIITPQRIEGIFLRSHLETTVIYIFYFQSDDFWVFFFKQLYHFKYKNEILSFKNTS